MANDYILTLNGNFISEDELYHYGVPGMKWGRRKKIDYAGEGIVSRKKQKLPGYVKGGPVKKPTLSTSRHARKMGDDIASAVNSAVNSALKAKKQTNNGKKKARKALSNAGSKTVKSASKAAKLGMSFAQSMWTNSDEGRNAREMSSYLNTASSMSPEYRRRFMYD